MMQSVKQIHARIQLTGPVQTISTKATNDL